MFAVSPLITSMDRLSSMACVHSELWCRQLHLSVHDSITICVRLLPSTYRIIYKKWRPFIIVEKVPFLIYYKKKTTLKYFIFVHIFPINNFALKLAFKDKIFASQEKHTPCKMDNKEYHQTWNVVWEWGCRLRREAEVN